MLRMILLPAVLTGFFCACFAIGVEWLTDMLDNRQLAMVSFTSGFLGSLFASLVLGKGRKS